MQYQLDSKDKCMRRVMQVVYNLDMGGAENLVFEYCLLLDKSQFEVVLLCFEHGNAERETILREHGVKLYFVCEAMTKALRNDIISRARQKWQRFHVVRRIIRKENPDVIHTHLLLNVYVVFAKPDLGTKIFHTVHSDMKRQWSEGRSNRQDFRAMKYLIRRYDTTIFALHKRMQKEINDLFGVTNTVVLNNGVEINRFQNCKDKKVVRRELGIPEDGFVIGCVGRFNKVKNHDLVIDIFREYSKRHDNAWLLLVGNGELKETIENKLDKLALLGQTLILSNRLDVPDIMKAMDIMLLTSFSEGVPLTLVEAQCAGIPAIVSDVVTEDMRISNLIRYKNINESVVLWVDEIERFKVDSVEYYNIEDWDIINIVKQLELMYEEK